MLLLALAAPAAAEPPRVLVCRGHEPEWSLRIDGSTAALATLDAGGLSQTGLDGRLQDAGGTVPSFIFRGRVGASGDLVAVITREACVEKSGDTAGGPADYSARLSLPDGGTRQGCCTVPVTPPPVAPAEPPAPTPPPAAAAEPPPVAPAAIPPAPSSAPTAATAEITAIVLPDGRKCQRASKEAATTPFLGQHVNFECGRRGGDTVALVGPLILGPEGLMTAQKALIEWRETGMNAQRPAETTPARVSEMALSDALTCRFAGTGATLAFEGLRVNYTCGMKDGETVALLGNLEPADGGFRIVRARIAQGAAGFVLRSSEKILVAAPR
jgi:hypothetical protein